MVWNLGQSVWQQVLPKGDGGCGDARAHGMTIVPTTRGATASDFATHRPMKNAPESSQLQGIAHHNQGKLLHLLAAGAFSHPDYTVGIGIPDVGPGTDSCIAVLGTPLLAGLPALAVSAACRITAGRELGIVSLTLP